MTSAQLICGVLVFVAAQAVASQDLPQKIRGYKVYRTNIAVLPADAVDAKRADVLVKLSSPTLKSIGIRGMTVEAAAEITSLGKGGIVDRLSFHDFTVNGIAVEIEDQAPRLKFKKNLPVQLSPVAVRIGPLGSAKATLRELTDAQTEWRITGTVLVFGRFRRFGFTFKRVIPIPIDLTLVNPLAK